MRDGPSHWLWILRVILFWEVILFTCYCVGMFVLQASLITFGCLQWDLAKVVRLRAFFAAREKNRRINGGLKQNNPGLFKLLVSNFACQHNSGIVQNWLRFLRADVPKYCKVADPNYPNLDHGLPRTAQHAKSSSSGCNGNKCGSNYHRSNAIKSTSVCCQEQKHRNGNPAWLVYVETYPSVSPSDNKKENQSIEAPQFEFEMARVTPRDRSKIGWNKSHRQTPLKNSNGKRTVKIEIPVDVAEII
eukprot:CAMPEP_0114487716 /NCGR_PEP_ID=MMETSP0109-20121206/925_1 /TAXON_ID=29199 /ORGANISM="Chlorarachnion reptans, Strain CCCM449" /LENGTH=245 /DNA_ID=CAMNT_0001664021 /DNA_START=413 /DNA_END=1150 /DNA_ORIENTATION=-